MAPPLCLAEDLAHTVIQRIDKQSITERDIAIMMRWSHIVAPATKKMSQEEQRQSAYERLIDQHLVLWDKAQLLPPFNRSDILRQIKEAIHPDVQQLADALTIETEELLQLYYRWSMAQQVFHLLKQKYQPSLSQLHRLYLEKKGQHTPTYAIAFRTFTAPSTGALSENAFKASLLHRLQQNPKKENPFGAPVVLSSQIYRHTLDELAPALQQTLEKTDPKTAPIWLTKEKDGWHGGWLLEKEALPFPPMSDLQESLLSHFQEKHLQNYIRTLRTKHGILHRFS